MSKKIVVEIVKQPPSVERFRYQSEGRTNRSKSPTTSKTYGSIRVLNYTGLVTVVVSCVTAEKPYRQHPNVLVGEDCKSGVCSIAFKTDESDPTVYSFNNMAIQCIKKSDIERVLTVREERNVDPFKTGFAHKKDKTFRTGVRLCFQIFIRSGDKFKPVHPIVSDIIRGNDSLKIYDISDSTSPTTGRKKIIVFCSKVSKGDIKVRFYREDENAKVEWEAWVQKPIIVHRQAAIVFETPAYATHDISEPVDVLFELVRPSDGRRSEPTRYFRYLPDPLNVFNLIRKKEQKITQSEVLFKYIQQNGDEEQSLNKTEQLNIKPNITNTKQLNIKPNIPPIIPNIPPIVPNIPPIVPNIPPMNTNIPPMNHNVPSKNTNVPSMNTNVPSMNSNVHAMNPNVHPVNPNVHAMNPNVHPVNPNVHPMNSNVHAMNPNVHPMNPNVHAMNPNVHAMNPNVHPMNPNVHPMNPNIHPINPNIPPMNANIPPMNANIPTINANQHSNTCTTTRPPATQSNLMSNFYRHDQASINGQSAPHQPTHFDNRSFSHNHSQHPTAQSFRCQYVGERPQMHLSQEYQQPHQQEHYQHQQKHYQHQQEPNQHQQEPYQHQQEHYQLQQEHYQHQQKQQQHYSQSNFHGMYANPGYGGTYLSRAANPGYDGTDLSSAAPYCPIPSFYTDHEQSRYANNFVPEGNIEAMSNIHY